MKRLPWRKDWVADEDAATAHLSNEELGAFERLRRSYWINGGLPNDDTRLASIARTSLEQWRSISEAIKPLFGPDWRSEKIDKELELGRQSYEKRAKAGSKGGSAKAANRSIATTMLYQSESDSDSASDSEFRLGDERFPQIVTTAARARAVSLSAPDYDDEELRKIVPF